ncbi:hypothetical protein [Marinobacter sp. F4216]|uniref:hypothetical protein n=1 Tax=Marinobacter sp. F4216 TaxID=2874281 RepID=UPI001CBD0033|nr:hypothetical protein [Marinobacter sp. F4216]MBZ2169331.1 hypothetical protein [Marinobacter sp. F4216]
MQLSKQEVEVVIEDIEYLRDQWAEGATDPELRRGSAILRRLVVEKYLGHAWRAMGHEKDPKIQTTDLDFGFNGIDYAEIECALAGGALSHGVYAACMCINKGGTAPEMQDGFLERELGLSNYDSSTCAIIKGSVITRSELIKYMANVKGGVHLGSSRARKKEQEIIKRVAKLEGKFNAFNSDGLFFETLSIGQSIAKSPDVVQLVHEFRQGA